jgi:hypothetical protein
MIAMSTPEPTSSPPAMPNARDAFYQFVQSRLQAKTGQTISEFILTRRESDKQMPYRRIASELIELTGVDLTHEAARRWYHRAIEDRARPKRQGQRRHPEGRHAPPRRPCSPLMSPRSDHDLATVRRGRPCRSSPYTGGLSLRLRARRRPMMGHRVHAVRGDRPGWQIADQPFNAGTRTRRRTVAVPDYPATVTCCSNADRRAWVALHARGHLLLADRSRHHRQSERPMNIPVGIAVGASWGLLS